MVLLIMIEAVSCRGVDSETAMIAAGFGVNPSMVAELSTRKVGLQIVTNGNEGAFRR
jgi:hypothetical protein